MKPVIDTSLIAFNAKYIGKETILFISHDDKSSQFYLPENWKLSKGYKELDNGLKLIIDQFNPKVIHIELYFPEEYLKLPSSKVSATDLLTELRERFKAGKSFTGVVKDDLTIIDIKDT